VSREDLELSKLHFEVESLKNQLTQAQQEKRKLELEVELLLSQVGRFGTFARVAWPIVSVILSTVIAGLALWFTFNQKSSELDHQKSAIAFSAIHDATDDSKGNDVRISAIWALSPFFGDNNETQFFSTAHTLVTVLVTGADDDNLEKAYSKHAIRVAAAEVLGRATPCQPNQKDVQLFTKRLLFNSVGSLDTPGLVSIEESSVVTHRAALKGASGAQTPGADLKLSAIRLVVERYRYCLANTDLSGYDLNKINFSGAHLEGADLRASDIRGGNLSGADLQGADLSETHLADTLNWRESNVNGTDIRSLQDAPVGFRDWALDQHAVEMESSAWRSWNSKKRVEPHDWSKWRASGFAVNRDGVPVQ